MIYLPVAVRELQVASRAKGTYTQRVVMGAAALALVLFWTMVSGQQPNQVGAEIFKFLSAGALGLCFFAGIQATSGAIAEERRDQTLGLLFLTDLTGGDVILGKLAAAAVRTCTTLLAVLPIFALPLLMGGVTGGEFFRTMLSLVLMLFLAMAIGLAVSSVARSPLAATGIALTLAFALIVVPTIIGSFSKNVVWTGGPLAMFLAGSDSAWINDPKSFWLATLYSMVLCTGALALASYKTIKSWRTEPKLQERFWEKFLKPTPRTTYGSLNVQHPEEWIAEKRLPGKKLLWVLIWIAASLAFLAGIIGKRFEPILFGSQLLLGSVIKLWACVLVPQHFSSARNEGSLELLLCTPVTPARLIRGQVDAVTEYFALPTAAGVGLSVVAGLIGSFLNGNYEQSLSLMGLMVVGILWYAFFLLDLYAMIYLGMWFGLTETRTEKAIAKTMTRVLLLPYLTTLIPVLGCLGFLIWPIFWMRWSSKRLHNRLRDEVSGARTTSAAG